MLARVEVSWELKLTFEMSVALWEWGRGARMFQHENGHYILHHAAALTEMKITVWWECRRDIGATCIYIHLHTHTHWHTDTDCIITHLQTSWTEVESAKETDNEKNIDLRMLSAALLPKDHYWSWATCIDAVGIQCFHCYLLGYNSLLIGWTELVKVSHITGIIFILFRLRDFFFFLFFPLFI